MNCRFKEKMEAWEMLIRLFLEFGIQLKESLRYFASIPLLQCCRTQRKHFMSGLIKTFGLRQLPYNNALNSFGDHHSVKC